MESTIFSGAGDAENMPSAQVSESDIADGIKVLDLLANVKFIPSKGEGRRLIQQGGVTVNDVKVTDFAQAYSADAIAGEALFNDGKIIVKKGKKSFLKIELA